MLCHECGQSMRRDETGVCFHLKEDGETDHDQDGDHVAYNNQPTISTLIDYLGQFDDPDNTNVYLNEADAAESGEFIELSAFFAAYEP